MPAHRPLGVLIKPTSSRCNLKCTYCFYLEKQAIYPWRYAPKLSLETFRLFFEQYAEISAPFFSVGWQGGEPTLMGLEFFRTAVEIEQRTLERLRRTRPEVPATITNALQTNGTLLDEEWVRFFQENGFLVGVSLDGPAEWHDRYRYDQGGKATHHRVLRAIKLLQEHQVDFNVLTVVSAANVERPRELLQYLVAHDLTNLQFIPCVERLPEDHPYAGQLSDFSITPEQYGTFLCELFDEWLKIGYQKVRIRYFDNLIQMALGYPAESCQLVPICGGYVVLEHNGDLYPCDFFVEPGWKLGNIYEAPLAELVSGQKFRQFGLNKGELAAECLSCRWRSMCYGECPRYRIIHAGTHQAVTYFCASYKQFFSSEWARLSRIAAEVEQMLTAPVMPGFAGAPTGGVQVFDTALTEAVRAARAADAAPPATARGPEPLPVLSAPPRRSTQPARVRPAAPQLAVPRAVVRSVGRNDPCPCGSGRKYKRCCGS